MHLTIKAQFMLLFSGVLLVSLLAAGMTFYQMTHINQSMTDVADNWLPSVKGTGDLLAAVEKTRIREARLLMSHPDQMEASEKVLAEAIEATNKAYNAYAPLISPQEPGYEEDLGNMQAFNEAWVKYQKTMHDLVEQKKAGVPLETLVEGFIKDDRDNYEQAGKKATDDVDFNFRSGVNAAEYAHDTYKQALVFIVIAVILSLLVTGGILLWIMKNISSSLKNLSQTYRHSATEVSTSTHATQSAVSQLVAASEETSTQTKVVLRNTTEAASYVSAVANSVRELNISIGDISRSIAETNEYVANAVQKSSETQEVVNKLGVSASQIGEVVQLINDLAAQTNLLALNAAIEAARAGEAGRGFAVVADEVKKLATNTSNATGSIQAQIVDIQTIAKQCTESLHMVIAAINKVQDNSTSVSAAVEEQSGVANHITSSVNDAADRVRTVESNMSGIEQASSDTSTASQMVSDASNSVSSTFDELNVQFRKEMDALGIRAS